ncbi:MAG: energy-coupling factor transporter transmembrane protein EcfT [Lachnospiraceae bacterium]|nr:energy-coupling factor transporter transmembrane protein EcfT [Lachnospiraceae bacterium]
MKNTFSAYHPFINLLFYIGAMVFGMILMHPAFLLCSVALAFAYYMALANQKSKYLFRMLVLFLVVAFTNPFFNHSGEKILFIYMNGRVYTLEALCYGMVLAAMFITVITWFASYNIVMTSDKFLYCFGRLLPAVSLLLTMVFRFVPAYKRQIGQIASARKCIGKSTENGTALQKAEHGMAVLSALASWAFEGGIVAADSMRSRGFGSGGRTSFSVYRWESRDRGLLFLMLVLIFGIIGCVAKGGAYAAYTPKIVLAGIDNRYTWMGVIFYGIFLSIPTVVNLAEECKWLILKSKI